jgi:hypothetical protein
MGGSSSSDAAKVAAIAAGVGLAEYGLYKVFHRKCKSCGGDSFQTISKKKGSYSTKNREPDLVPKPSRELKNHNFLLHL